MHPGGLEPPTVGLKGRCSAIELRVLGGTGPDSDRDDPPDHDRGALPTELRFLLEPPRGVEPPPDG